MRSSPAGATPRLPSRPLPPPAGTGSERPAAELECSRKHLIAVFRDQIGLPPKTVARVLRFQRAIRLYDGGGASWVDVAYACGYADEAHFIKDFRRFAGATPQAFLATRHPGEGAAATV